MSDPVTTETPNALHGGRSQTTVPLGRTEAGRALQPKFKMSMSQMTTYRWSLEEDISHYQAAGIESIGIWRRKLIDYGDEAAIDLINESRLNVSSVSWAGGFTGTHGYTLNSAIQDAEHALRMSSAIDADCLVIASGPRSGHTSNHARRLLISALTELADIAAVLDVNLALHPMHQQFSREWTFINSIDQTLDILDAVDHPAVKMVFDAYHLCQEDNLINRLPALIPHIGIVQLSDWNGGERSDADRCQLGDGIVPVQKITDCLAHNFYRGHVDIQLLSEELWKSDYETLLDQCQVRFDELCMASVSC